MAMESLGPREVVLTSAVHQRASVANGLSAAASGPGETVFLGTLDGQVEEHRLIRTGGHPRLRLIAKRSISKKAIAELCFVESASILVVLTEGLIRFLNPETFEGAILSSMKEVTAVAVRKGGKIHLVVAQRMSASGVRFSVLAIPATTSGRIVEPQRVLFMDFAERASVKDVDWLGNKVLFRTALGYSFFLPRARGVQPLFEIQDNAISRTQLLLLPGHHQALLLSDQVGIIIDAEGTPTGSPLTFPSSPAALAAVGSYVVAVCGRGVYVYDLSTRTLVQSLLMPLTATSGAEEDLFVQHSPTGNQFFLLSTQRIWMFQVSTLETQVRHLLMTGDFSNARDVLLQAAAIGYPWVETAYAQLGLLLLEDLMVTEAIDALSKCKMDVFHPAQLFPLFPAVTQPWQSSIQNRKYWGLHRDLPALDDLILRHKEFMSSHDLATAGKDAEKAVANFLLKVRSQPGMDLLDAIDTLLICLLSRQQMTAALMAFVRQPNHADVAIVEANLKASGDLNALAFLYANSGRPHQALEIWKDFVDEDAASTSNDREEMLLEQSTPSSSNREDAIANAVQLVQEPDRLDDSAAMAFLKWLLKTSPGHTLEIIKGRSLSQAEVLALMRSQRSTALRACLEYYVMDLSSTEPALHSELILLLCDEIESRLPERDPSMTTKEIVKRMLTLEAVHPLRQKLQHLLNHSALYDVDKVTVRLSGTELYEEQIIAAEKAGDFRAALEGLALTLGDPGRAEALCGRIGEHLYVMLLEVLLHPVDGQPPLYREACRLLSTHGAHLDPMRVVDTLSDDMPLTNAANVLSSMLCERLHRRRQGLLLRNLRRAVHFSAAADRVSNMQGFVVVQDGRRCQNCHLLLGDKLFAVYPDSTVLCYACADKIGLQVTTKT